MRFDDPSRLPHPDVGLAARALGFSTASLGLLRDLILQRTGQYYGDHRLDLLADRISELVAAAGLGSFLDYYYMLKYGEDPDGWTALLDALAVPETYFWRQFEQVEALCTRLLPAHARLRPGQPVTIWSAACCSGEEPLSIVMALHAGGWFDRMNITVRGTDASAALIERARKGVYGERAMRAIPAAMRDRYFTREAPGWRIDRSIHEHVHWGVANLADAAETAPLARADVIYCRNVFIYFADSSVEYVANTFSGSMPEWGYLFLGASESLLRLNTDFQLAELGSAFAYRRTDGRHPVHRAAELSADRRAARAEESDD